MAAGMGSRYGGLKQIDPVDKEGQIIMDFSIYDAKQAGFEKVVFIIKKENENDFREAIGNRIEKFMDVAYAYQDINNIPAGFSVPEGRVKPWGTAHAVLSAADEIDGPFAVINADDYYGQHAFKVIYEYLTTHEDDEKYRYTMVGYRLKNTVTDNGYVSRGVCELNEQKELVSVTERTRIEKKEDGIAFSEDDGKTWNMIKKRHPNPAYVDPAAFIAMLSEKLEDDAVYVADVGQNQIWSCAHHIVKEGRFLTSGGMGTMGYSIPAAMGAKLGDPKRQVVAVCGDGSFQMSMMELATMRQHNIPVKIIILKNNYLGMVREYQHYTYKDRYSVVELTGSPDLEKLSSAYGMDFLRLENMEHASKTLDIFLEKDESVLLECLIDPMDLVK